MEQTLPGDSQGVVGQAEAEAEVGSQDSPLGSTMCQPVSMLLSTSAALIFILCMGTALTCVSGEGLLMQIWLQGSIGSVMMYMGGLEHIIISVLLRTILVTAVLPCQAINCETAAVACAYQPYGACWCLSDGIPCKDASAFDHSVHHTALMAHLVSCQWARHFMQGVWYKFAAAFAQATLWPPPNALHLQADVMGANGLAQERQLQQQEQPDAPDCGQEALSHEGKGKPSLAPRSLQLMNGTVQEPDAASAASSLPTHAAAGSVSAAKPTQLHVTSKAVWQSADLAELRQDSVQQSAGAAQQEPPCHTASKDPRATQTDPHPWPPGWQCSMNSPH